MVISKKQKAKTDKKNPQSPAAANLSPAQLQAIAKKRKRKKIKNIALGVAVFLAFVTWLGLQPLKAGIEYGICRTFVENNIRYPTTYQITQYDIYGSSLRLFYTYVDPFGGTRSDMIECIIVPHPQNGYMVQEISINREPIDEERLARFNMAIPGILLGKPNLVIPRPADEDDLTALRTE